VRDVSRVNKRGREKGGTLVWGATKKCFHLFIKTYK